VFSLSVAQRRAHEETSRMNRRRSLIVLVVAALIGSWVTQASAQAPATFQAGARVEVKTYGTDGTYQGGTITQVDDQRPTGGNLKYLIHLDVPSPDSKISDVSAFENEVRALVAFTPFNVSSVVSTAPVPGRRRSSSRLTGGSSGTSTSARSPSAGRGRPTPRSRAPTPGSRPSTA
jgi:hypothetical protein